VHVLMNNCYRDYGVRNAREIGEMLGTLGSRKKSDVRRQKSEEQGRLA
jgi:hypothetical protein